MNIHLKNCLIIFVVIVLLTGCSNSTNSDRSKSVPDYISTDASNLTSGKSVESNNLADAETGTNVIKNTSSHAIENRDTVTSRTSISSSTQSSIQLGQHKEEPPEQCISEIISIYKDLYIGELVDSGYIYIEPFSVKRNNFNEEIKFDKNPHEIKFHSLSKADKIFDANFDSVFNTYVPHTEESSIYFLQSFSEPNQYVLKYKTKNNPGLTQIGISLLNHEIAHITAFGNNKIRPHSQKEYNAALKLIEKDKEIDKSDRTLDYITLENTIVGAQEICLVSIKDSKSEIMISKYLTHGFEYVADVYVADFIKDGRVIKTYEKYNWDGPY